MEAPPAPPRGTAPSLRRAIAEAAVAFVWVVAGVVVFAGAADEGIGGDGHVSAVLLLLPVLPVLGAVCWFVRYAFAGAGRRQWTIAAVVAAGAWVALAVVT
mgnify:FL=1